MQGQSPRHQAGKKTNPAQNRVMGFGTLGDLMASLGVPDALAIGY
jgi:hypothetical protein